MKDIKKTMVTVFTVFAVLGATVGIYVAIHSPLFLVQVIEVADQPESAPLDSQSITQLAAVPTGIVNLFDLDLKAVERRVLANHWIKEVKLQKKFPQTLTISVIFREPRALLQSESGTMSYVDSDGNAFGQLNLLLSLDLPILTGFSSPVEGRSRIQEALRVVGLWENSAVSKVARISTLSWDSEQGYRAVVFYNFGGKINDSTTPAAQGAVATAGSKPQNRPQGRTWISLGQEIDGQFEAQLGRIAQVFNYLSVNSIPTKQIWADVGKKVVVKSVRGS
jgi:hypothetical protein